MKKAWLMPGGKIIFARRRPVIRAVLSRARLRVRQWFNTPRISVKRFLGLSFFVALLFTGLGYFWHLSAVRPVYQARMLEKDATIQRLTLRLADAEGKVKIVRVRGKR